MTKPKPADVFRSRREQIMERAGLLVAEQVTETGAGGVAGGGRDTESRNEPWVCTEPRTPPGMKVADGTPKNYGPARTQVALKHDTKKKTNDSAQKPKKKL